MRGRVPVGRVPPDPRMRAVCSIREDRLVAAGRGGVDERCSPRRLHCDRHGGAHGPARRIDLGVGDYQVGKATGYDGLGLGFPVRAGGHTTGITYEGLSLSWLGQRVERQSRRPARDLLVIDDHGTVLAHAGRTTIPVGTNLGASPLVKKALRLDHSRGRTKFEGGRLFAAIDVVPLSGGAIHVAATGRR